jgi:hypothetical protein
MNMENNPYDTTIQCIPQQNQYNETGSDRPLVDQQHLIRPLNQDKLRLNRGQKPKAPQKMSKARALALANTLKRWFAVASIVGFGTFAGLVALHRTNTTATQSAQTTSGSSNTNSKSGSSSQNNNGFLNQQGGNTGGTSSSSTTSSSQGTSSGSNTTSSTPVTGTSTS